MKRLRLFPLLLIGAGMWCILPSIHLRVQIPIAAAADSTVCPYKSSLDDGCSGAQAHGIIPYPHLADFQKVIMVNVVGGRDYVDGKAYVWTSNGGGCTTAATGTVDVSGGKLTNGQITNEGAGCSARPNIPVPAAAGAGSGGRIVPTVYQLTPHNTTSTYNLPGVDYPVGYDTTMPLKDPTAGDTLPSCASYAGNFVTIKSSNCTIDGFDFSLHGINLVVASNLTGTLITNNKFAGNGNALQILQVKSGTCDVTIKYNQFDGGANGPMGSGYRLTSAILSYCYSGQIAVEYNYCFNVDSKCLFIGGGVNSPHTIQVTERFNVYSEIAICAVNCDHGEAEYSYSAYTSGIVYQTINPWIMKFNVALTSYRPTIATAEMAIEADAVNITNADVEYNYILTPGPMAATGSRNPGPVSMSASMYCGYQENGSNTNGVMLHNLIDYTGAYFPYNTSGGTCPSSFPSMSDFNAVTGHPCNYRSCN